MAGTIGERVAQHARETLIGRSAELERLGTLLAPDGPFVTFLHGLGGIGKSSLLNAFARHARDQGATVVQLDCRLIEPSERGFVRELEHSLGGDIASLPQAVDRLGALSDQLVILTLDTYEQFRLMDTWMRRVFVPLLPANARVLLSGREPPVAAWLVSPGWSGLFQALRLEPLPEQDALALLLQSGVAKADAHPINAFARGHPMSLCLAAALAERPGIRFDDVTSQRVIAQLSRIYLRDVPGLATRRALEAASVLRRVTYSLLGAMLPDHAPQDAYDRRRKLGDWNWMIETVTGVGYRFSPE